MSRECASLVDAEIAKLKAKDVAANILVKAETVSAGTLNDFEKRLLGVAGSDVTVNIDAASYAKAFDQVVAASKDKNSGMRNGYIGLCIALGMDPLVFIY